MRAIGIHSAVVAPWPAAHHSATPGDERKDGSRKGHPQTEADFPNLHVFDRDLVASVVFQFRLVNHAVAQAHGPVPSLIDPKTRTGIQHIANLEAAFSGNGVGGLIERNAIAQIRKQHPRTNERTDDVVRYKGIDGGEIDGNDCRRGDLDADALRVVADHPTHQRTFQQNPGQRQTQTAFDPEVIGNLIADPAIQGNDAAVLWVIALLRTIIARRDGDRETKTDRTDPDSGDCDILLLGGGPYGCLAGVFQIEFRGEQTTAESRIKLPSLGTRGFY